MRQAHAGNPLYYSDLALELGMPNPRNLNFVLGSIGRTLENLSKLWREKIPPLECLVLNKSTNLPGDGVGGFLISRGRYEDLSKPKKREVVRNSLALIMTYDKWFQVLEFLQLQPAREDFSTLINRASKLQFRSAEGPEHKALKEYVAKHPAVVGLGENAPLGITEKRLPSGDSLDVSFHLKKSWVGVEVKSRISPEADIVRGLFQCVKYLAVMRAVLNTENQKEHDVRAVLVIESDFPEELIGLRNALGVEVIDHVIPKK